MFVDIEAKPFWWATFPNHWW